MQMAILNSSFAHSDVQGGREVKINHHLSPRKVIRELTAREAAGHAVAGEQAYRLQGEPRISLVRVSVFQNAVGVRWSLRVGTFSVDADILVEHGSLMVNFSRLPYGLLAKRDHLGVEKLVTGEDHLHCTVRKAIQKLLHLS